MKSKKLIALIQEIDPTGEVEVCVNNMDILEITGEPAYWDGCLQVLEWNEHENVIGVETVQSGMKINLAPYSLFDAIQHDPDIPIKLCSSTEWQKDDIKKRRKEADDLHKKYKHGKYYEKK